MLEFLRITTPVLAARGGIVVTAKAGTPTGSPSASNTVAIVHPDPINPSATDRFQTRYLHLAGPDKLTVSGGMIVLAGQRLGRMDDTGNSVFNHLHFAIHDKTLPHAKVTYGRSVRPTPMSGATLGDGDSGRCVLSNNV